MNSKTQKNLRQKIGQLFILGFVNDHINEDDPIASDIVEENLGGVILFDRHLASGSRENNICSLEQVQKLTEQLNTLALQRATTTDSYTKLIIAVDQEGGHVNRFKAHRNFPTTKTAEECGSLGLSATKQAASQTASMLATMGINLNFAPVADLASNPKNPIISRFGRSFSADPEIVTRLCLSWIEEHKKHRIANCLKHFPGHGSSSEDTHFDFTDISTTWHKKELLPYEILIKKDVVDSVMMGHIFLQQLDSQWPASLSPNAVSLLRQELKFDKLIFSDDMQMRAISSKYGIAEACVQSIRAGVDALIIGNNLVYDHSILRKIKEYCMQCIEQETLSEERINDAFHRIQRFKQQLL